MRAPGATEGLVKPRHTCPLSTVGFGWEHVDKGENKTQGTCSPASQAVRVLAATSFSERSCQSPHQRKAIDEETYVFVGHSCHLMYDEPLLMLLKVMF